MTATIIRLSDRRPPSDRLRAAFAAWARKVVELNEVLAELDAALEAERAGAALRLADVLDGLPSDCEPPGPEAA